MPVCVDCGVSWGTAKSRSPRCPECRKSHYNASWKAWKAANPEKAREIWRNNDAKPSNRARHAAYMRRYHERTRASRTAKTDTTAWGIVNGPKLRTCPRLHVTALHLPCGQREECHLNPVCEHAGGTKARNANWGWRGGDGGSLERVPRKGRAA